MHRYDFERLKTLIADPYVSSIHVDYRSIYSRCSCVCEGGRVVYIPLSLLPKFYVKFWVLDLQEISAKVFT